MHASQKAMNSYGPIKGIVLLGGGRLLRQLCLWAKSQSTPLKVVTSPRHASESLDNESLSEFLTRNGVEHISVDDISAGSVVSFLGSTRDHFCLSLGAAWIFKKDVIAAVFDDRLLNLHGTRLPQNRGGGGFSWQILMGNRFGFCVLHRIDGGVDTGEIIAVEEFLYPATARRPIDYENVYVEKNLGFILGFLERHRSQTLPIAPLSQPEYLSTYWPRLNTDLNGWIDWSLEPVEIERMICAFDEPYQGAQTYLNDEKVRIKSVCVSSQDGAFHAFQSGIVYRKGPSWLCVALRGSTLIVEGVYGENGKDVLSTVRVGDRFVTPWDKLHASLKRPVYTPKGIK